MSDTPRSPAAPACLLYEGTWAYPGYHGCRSLCHLRLFQPAEPELPLIAIFTELDTNPGTSVTNRIEVLAAIVWQQQERPERGLTVVEHYPNRGMHNPIKNRWQFPEDFDIVTFEQACDCRFIRPKWRRVGRHAVEEMIGQPFSTIFPALPSHQEN